MRTSATAVMSILGDNYSDSISLEPFIETASGVVDQLVNYGNDIGVTVSTALQELIERWLAAHYYAIADQLYSSKSTQGASATFQGQTGMGLDATLYGQQAKSLDITGYLRMIDKGISRVSVLWLGKPPSEQIDYVDRD